MTERPILFSGPMVRAILAGTKTMTRRVVKPQPVMHDGEPHWPHQGKPRGRGFEDCPYGQPGSKLWVRETWGYIDPECSGEDYDEQDGPGSTAFCEELLQEGHPLRDFWRRRVAYRATWKDAKYGAGPDAPKRWRPSIYMPRWASRITLEVTDVRVERLQDISEADTVAEGIPAGEVSPPDAGRFAYRLLWDDINGPGSWPANPWVWVVQFRRVAP